MNIHIQTYGMIILTLLFIFYKTHKPLRLYSETIFCRSLYVSIFNLALDIISLIVIGLMDELPLFTVELVCKTYIISLIWEGLCALCYVLTDLYPEKKHRKVSRRLRNITICQSIVIAFLPIEIYRNGSVAYTYGISVIFVYIFALIYISLIVCICAFNKKLNRRRRFAVGLWMSIWIVSAFLQFVNNELLLVGFATAIGILILFVIMENPESYLDKKLGCFNSYALAEYLHQIYERKLDFSVLEVSFGEVDSSEESDIYAATQRMLDLTFRHSDIFVFKNFNSDLIVIGPDAEKLAKIGRDILKHFFERNYRDGKVLLAENGEVFSGMEELSRFLDFAGTLNTSNSYVLFHAGEDTVSKFRERYIIQQEITDALADDRVEVFLQPIYSNNEKAFTSAEALVRIRGLDEKLLSPGIFIPVAEESGQIVQLGERVFEKVCEFLKETNAVELGIHYIEINLSVVQCEMSDLAERLISIIEKYGISPKLINLEITETASVTAHTTLLRNMHKLIEYGFEFSLDDFGKGESNLMYVVEMPVSLIKLDYDMTKAFFKTEKAQHVVRAVVGMAHSMNLKLVAEGIETEDEIKGMYEERIDYIQGYYYSRPLPMQRFLEFLQT